MPTGPFYTPPAIRRYFATTTDPNSTSGGSSLDIIAGNTSAGVTADTANFPSATIPDVTAVIPVTTADLSWNPGKINRDPEVTGVRAGRADIPFKVQPTITWTCNAYQYALEKALKRVMGAEGTITGAGPYTHPLSPVAFGAVTAQPSLIGQMIRDDINHKWAGSVYESLNLTFPFDGAGSFTVEEHPMYVQQIPKATAQPTGVITAPTSEPMVIRDAIVVYDGGATSEFGVSQFTFNYSNGSSYDRQVAGRCIESKTLGSPSITRKLWYPAYHKVAGRQKVTWSLNFLDVKDQQEIASQWGQIQKIVVTVADPNSTTSLIRFTHYATEISDGGVDALTATGDQTASFTGGAFYSASDGADILVESVNAIATAL